MYVLWYRFGQLQAVDLQSVEPAIRAGYILNICVYLIWIGVFFFPLQIDFVFSFCFSLSIYCLSYCANMIYARAVANLSPRFTVIPLYGVCLYMSIKIRSSTLMVVFHRFTPYYVHSSWGISTAISFPTQVQGCIIMHVCVWTCSILCIRMFYTLIFELAPFYCIIVFPFCSLCM